MDIRPRPSGLTSYVPALVSDWATSDSSETWRQVEGSLVFVDISGFTRLSERLAGKGRVGAEELTGVINRVFGKMLEVSVKRGGSLLKFGGDALLLLFRGEDHVLQATAATVEMRAVLREAAQMRTSVGRINLRMSSGIHTGKLDAFLVGDSHRELVLAGPAVSTVTRMEHIASAGEIVVSDQVRGQIPPDFVGAPMQRGWLLRKRKVNHPHPDRTVVDPFDEMDLTNHVPLALRDHLSLGVTDSEHRIATVGFVRFGGVDQLIEEKGPGAAGEEIDAIVRDVQAAVDNEGVTFLATDVDEDGGKIILATGVPGSQHDDEGRMLRAARLIVDIDSRLGVRAGLNRGHVFSGNVGTTLGRTYTVMGDTVNLAARLMASAPPGSLYASPSVLDRSSTLFRTESLDPLDVKGKEQPVQAYEVFEESGVRPPEMGYDLPFRGRDAEVEMIVGIVTTCARVGRGGVMTIAGDVGIGKTRLISEVLDRCPGLDTLMMQAEPYASDNPYWVFRDAMRRMLEISRAPNADMAAQAVKAVRQRAPDLAWALPLLGDVLQIQVPDNDETSTIAPQFRPDRTADVVIELLETLNTGPFAVVAEDGQWLDDASLALLRRIGDAAESRPWTVIVTARTDTGEFGTVGTRIRLRPLPDDVSRDIAIATTAAAPLRPHQLDLVVSRSGGNPLFLGEILAVIRDTGSAGQLPESLDAVVSTQIDTLAPLARQLLRYSAVLGSSFRRVVLNRFLEPEPIELDDATERELSRFLEADGTERIRFRHAVVHDVAYEGLSYGRRKELHARAGAVVEELAGADTDAAAEVLATHYSLSGDYEKVWRYARVAADRAKKTYSNTEAATQYQRAIESSHQIDLEDKGELSVVWTRLGEVQELVGQFEAARDSYSTALRSVGDDPLTMVDLHLLRARAWMNLGNLTQAKRNISLGRRRIADHDDPKRSRAVARLDAFESVVHMSAGDPAEALTCAAAAVDRAGGAGEEEALARAYESLDWANFMLGNNEPRHGEKTIAILTDLGLLERSVDVMNNMGAFAYLEGKWDEAAGWYRQAVDAAEKSGNVYSAATTRANIAEVLIAQRNYEEGLKLIEDAGRVIVASNASGALPFVRLQTAKARIGAGDREVGMGELEALLTSQLDGEKTPWTGETAVSMAVAQVAEGQPEAALATLERLEARAPEAATRAIAGVLRAKGLALEAAGDAEGAVEAFSFGLAAAVESGELYEEALILDHQVELAGRAGASPDPTDIRRRDELFGLLGISSLQPS